MPPGRGRPCDSNAPIESRPRPLHLLLWPLTGLQEWVWRAINNALPYRLAMSRRMAAAIKSIPQGGLSFSYWLLDCPGRPTNDAPEPAHNREKDGGLGYRE
jgi:hypothetical protein